MKVEQGNVLFDYKLMDPQMDPWVRTELDRLSEHLNQLNAQLRNQLNNQMNRNLELMNNLPGFASSPLKDQLNNQLNQNLALMNNLPGFASTLPLSIEQQASRLELPRLSLPAIQLPALQLPSLSLQSSPSLSSSSLSTSSPSSSSLSKQNDLRYRIAIDCPGYHQSSIKTEIKDNHLIVSAEEEEGQIDNNGDHRIKKFKNSYTLPENVLADKMVSSMIDGKLIVEMPFKEERLHLHTTKFPEVVDENGKRLVNMNVIIPENIDPSKISVSVQGRDVVIKAEDRVEKADGGISKFYYYRRNSLPEDTILSELKCLFVNNQLKISAPLDNNYNHQKSIPIQIEFEKKKLEI